MKNIAVNKTKTNLWVDIIILLAFLTVYEVKATGETIHEWLGIAIGFIVIIHILLHWKWLVLNTKQFLTRIKTEARLNYIVDILIFVGFTTIIFTGIMISKSFLPTLGIRVAENHFWRSMHSVSVDITLFLTAFHFALHWDWIVRNFKRYIINPLKSIKNSEKLPEPEFAMANNSNSSKLRRIVKTSSRFFIILGLSSLISFGWYAISGNISAEISNPEYRKRVEQNGGTPVKADADKKFERFDSENKENHGEKERHDEGGLFILEVLKNLLIFSIVTIVVTKASKKIKRKNTAGLSVNS